MRWLLPRDHTLALQRATQLACAVALVYFATRWLVLAEGHEHQSSLGDLLLTAQVAGALVVYLRAAMATRGTRRALLAGLATSAAFAVVGHAAWFLLAAGGLPRPPLFAAAMGLGAQGAVLLGFAAALGRQRAGVRLHLLTDALLLVVAAAIVIVQLEVSTDPSPAAGRALPLAWSILAEANLILLALLLVYRGEALGTRVATTLSVATLSLVVGNFVFSRATLFRDAHIGEMVGALWSLATLGFVTIAGRWRGGAAQQTLEVPSYTVEAGHIRTASIVIAILIAAGTATQLGLSGRRDVELAVAVGLFGVLLAVRAGHTLWSQHRAAAVLERAVAAERGLSVTLEHRVAAHSHELAKAQRVLQRMWTLGQEIALELNPERVLERFVEGVRDLLQADGASVSLLADGGDSLRVAQAVGLSAPLRGRTLPAAATAVGRAARAGRGARHTDVVAEMEDEANPACHLLAGDPVRGMAIAPLVRRGERIGAVAVTSRAPRAFTDAEMSALETMADLLSVALANAELVENLRQAEWRFRTLFRAAPDAVMTVFESGRIREANDAVRDVFGVYPLQVIGRTLAELAAPDDRDRVARELARAQDGEPVRFEARFLCDGVPRTVSLAARLLPEADPPTVLCVGRDVTVEREMRARLAETERLAAVGELVAGVAHEVNNPLSTISAFAQLLLRDGGMTAEQREQVDVIRAETMRASQVVKDLLTFARRSESRRLSLDLNEIVERAVRVSSYEISTRQIAVEAALAPDLPRVFGDPRQLQQVVLNLVTNAIQAMAPQGRGTLRVTTRAEAGGERVVLEVADSGPGIPERARAHIFQPFFTTKEQGTGLGLSVSYGIVTAHGGTIALARTGSSGTVMRVMLRASGALAETAREQDVPPLFHERSPLEGLRLLFVDDEPALRDVMVAFGRLRGIAVTVATDGAEALAWTRREPFDAVVCDLRMPGMDGAAFHAALRAEQPTLAARTIFVTGDVVGEASRAFLETTTQTVLVKPFEFERVEEALAAALEAEAVS
jgi:two-component system NtrC family sensor kinase